jgi:hypothetical protein
LAQKLLPSRGYDFYTSSDQMTVKDIKEKSSYVSLDKDN